MPVKIRLGAVLSEFRFVCFRGLHKNDPRNHTKSHEQSCFVWLRGSFSISSQSLKIRKLTYYPKAQAIDAAHFRSLRFGKVYRERSRSSYRRNRGRRVVANVS